MRKFGPRQACCLLIIAALLLLTGCSSSSMERFARTLGQIAAETLEQQTREAPAPTDAPAPVPEYTLEEDELPWVPAGSSGLRGAL